MAGLGIKIGACVALFSSVTTGSYFIRGYYSTERISHRISDQGMTFLSASDNDAEWAKRWKEYVEDKTPNKWSLKDFEKDKKVLNKVPKSFKDKCLNSSYLAVEGNESFATEIERFCTKSFSVANILKNEKGIKLLSKEGDNEQAWKAAYEKYFSESQGEKNYLKLDNWSSTSRKKDSLPSDYKDKCIKASEEEVRTNKNTVYINVKNYCTELTKK